MQGLIKDIGGWAPHLLGGLELTVILTFTSFGIALVGGLLLAVPRVGRQRMWFLRLPAGAIVEFIRGTPLILQLFYVFYVFPYFGLRLSAVAAAIVGLSINYSAYLSEVYRSGIEAIPKTQFEAAEALGLEWGATMRFVVLPQAVRIVIPAMANYLIALFKDSALASTISVTELLFSGQLLASVTFQYIGIYSTVFVMYFLISYPAILGVRALERQMAKSISQ